MMKFLTALTFTILVSVSFAETKIYKHIDEQGNVHYSDKKPTPDAKEADLPELTIFESKKYQKKPTATKESKQTTKPEPGLLENFKIKSPLNDETIINTGGKVNANVQLNGDLPDHLIIRFYLNDVPQKSFKSASIELNNIFRGEHEIYAKAININQNKVVKTTPKVKFYVRQNVKKR